MAIKYSTEQLKTFHIPKMDESSVLEMALINCKSLQRYIKDSIKQVRRLNARYNSEWMQKNYSNYMLSIVSEYRCRSLDQKGMYALKGARSSIELFGANRKINYKFIKIKRSMETLIVHIQRAIEIGNRQRDYMHVNAGGRSSKVLLCCH